MSVITSFTTATAIFRLVISMSANKPVQKDKNTETVLLSDAMGVHVSVKVPTPQLAKFLLSKSEELRQMRGKSEALGMMDDWQQLQQEVKTVSASFQVQEAQVEQKKADAERKLKQKSIGTSIGIITGAIAGSIGSFLMARKTGWGKLAKGLSAAGGLLGGSTVLGWITFRLSGQGLMESVNSYASAITSLNEQQMQALSEVYDAYQKKLDAQEKELARSTLEDSMTRSAIPRSPSFAAQADIEKQTAQTTKTLH